MGGAAGGELVSAAHSAFVDAMAMGIRVAAAVALVAAIGAVFALPRRHAEVPGAAAAAGALAPPATVAGAVPPAAAAASEHAARAAS